MERVGYWGMAPCIPDSDTKWCWGVSIHQRYPLVRSQGGPQSRSGRCREGTSLLLSLVSRHLSGGTEEKDENPVSIACDAKETAYLPGSHSAYQLPPLSVQPRGREPAMCWDVSRCPGIETGSVSRVLRCTWSGTLFVYTARNDRQFTVKQHWQKRS
jgi:hypothetical protein